MGTRDGNKGSVTTDRNAGWGWECDLESSLLTQMGTRAEGGTGSWHKESQGGEKGHARVGIRCSAHLLHGLDTKKEEWEVGYEKQGMGRARVERRAKRRGGPARCCSLLLTSTARFSCWSEMSADMPAMNWRRPERPARVGQKQACVGRESGASGTKRGGTGFGENGGQCAKTRRGVAECTTACHGNPVCWGMLEPRQRERGGKGGGVVDA